MKNGGSVGVGLWWSWRELVDLAGGKLREISARGACRYDRLKHGKKPYLLTDLSTDAHDKTT